jgi:rare lipoprotein A
MARGRKPHPIKACLLIEKSPARHAHSGPLHQWKEAVIVKRTRLTFVATFCLAIVFIGGLSIAKAQSGIASVYSGGRTANGEIASAGGMTAAHKTFPFGTLVRVTHRPSGRSVVVRINDRGPFVRGRVIDVTPAAARVLGFSGLALVTLDVIGRHS